MKRITLIFIVLLICLSIIGCSAASPYPDTMWTQDILPGTTNTYNLGSVANRWHNIYVENIITPGGSIHNQNTDTILTTDGTTQLINAGVVINDFISDRWLNQLTNTFFGVGTAGAGNLSHTGGIEGYENTAFGCDAGSSLLTGYSNTYVGNNAGEGNTSGYNNVAIGADALNNASTVDSNVAVGDQAMMNATGGKNTALGKGAMGGAGAGEYNTVVGLQALGTPSGSWNTAIGVWAGQLNTGSSNVFVGYRAGDNSGAVSDKLYIDNSNTATPLIYGDFSTNSLTVNGDLIVTGKLKVTMTIYANNAAAVAGGLAVGTFYRTGGDPDLVCVVH